MNPKFYCLFMILAINQQLLQASNDIDSDHENNPQEEEDQLDYSKVQVDTLYHPDTCTERAKTNDFLTLHLTSRWLNGPTILSTNERNVPIEIQLGTKMISPGLDHGLEDICVGEKRKIVIPVELGLVETQFEESKQYKEIEYEVELLSLSSKMTLNTFRYLDVNQDRKISAHEAEGLVKMFLHSLSSGIPGIDVNQLIMFFISMHDKNGDSQISESEFLESLSDYPIKDEL